MIMTYGRHHCRQHSCPAAPAGAGIAAPNAKENSKPAIGVGVGAPQPHRERSHTLTLLGGLRDELGSFNKGKVGPASTDRDDLGCRCDGGVAVEPQPAPQSKQPSLRVVGSDIVPSPEAEAESPHGDLGDDHAGNDDEAEAAKSLRSIGGITDELIRTKLELAKLKERSERLMNTANQKEEVLTRRVESLGRAKEKFRKIARRLSNVPELAIKSGPSSGEVKVTLMAGRRRSASDDRTVEAEPFRFLGGLSEEKCDYVPPSSDDKPPKGSSRTIDPDELLWSRGSMEFDLSGSLRRVGAAGGKVDARTGLTRGISSKRLRDHLGAPDADNAAAAIADQAVAEAQRMLSGSLHRRRGSTFW